MITIILKDLFNLKDEIKSFNSKKFFKTGPGEYGEGDLFLGITVPKQREIAKKYYQNICLEDVEKLIKDKYHEVRLTALIILTYKMKEADLLEQEKIVNLYLKNTRYINNWDLVDTSAHKILGYYLDENKIDRTILYDLAASDDLWQQRIAIISTAYFIDNNDYTDTLSLAKLLLNHNHDLIHKAVGWMLREIGKRDYGVEYKFLLKYYQQMPRTMLRYAIEKFDKNVRESFMKAYI